MYDALVIGGGIMGCTTALHLARGGMRVAVIERRGLCMEASGVNAGTLSLQIKRKELMPYALKGWELWKTASDWLGDGVGFHQLGGLTLSFTDDEAELLENKMRERAEAGAPIEFVHRDRAREIEPGLSNHPVLASFCPLDGYAQSNEIGRAYRAALIGAGVQVFERSTVSSIEKIGANFAVTFGGNTKQARRLTLAGGAWLGRLGALLGVELPVEYRVNQVSVTERIRPILRTIIGVVSDPLSTKEGPALGTSLVGTLTLKQSSNGTVLIGGGWQGIGDLDRGGYQIRPEYLIGNLRQAHYAIPALADARVARTWCGVEGHVPDFMPLAGPIPGVENAFVVGCCRGGFTIGPYLGRILAQRILEQEPEMPLFDPGRFAPAPLVDSVGAGRP